MKYFYIIKRNGVIYEVPFSLEGYQGAMQEHIKGGIIIVRPKGYENPQSTNAKDIVDVVDGQGYDTYIHTANPKMYLRDGVWYDGKLKGEVRLEPWKQVERDKQKQVAAPPDKPPTPAEKKKVEQRRKEISKFVRNGFKKK